MYADSKLIEWLLENETQYRIAKDTGVTQSKLSELKNKKIKMENLTFGIAATLTEYAKEKKGSN